MAVAAIVLTAVSVFTTQRTTSTAVQGLGAEDD